VTLRRDEYIGLLSDEARIGPYLQAIAQLVRGGATVADIGAGLGTFSVAAALAGAARVYAVESDDIAGSIAELAAANGVGSQVEVIRGRSTECDPPERVDLCLFDDFALLDWAGDCAATVADARDRWLKDGGSTLPSAVEAWFAPAGEQALLGATTGALEASGFRTEGFARLAGDQPFSLKVAGEHGLVAAPSCLASANLGEHPPVAFNATASGTMTRDGHLVGLVGWIRLQLCDELSIDTGPLAPGSAYPQVFFPLPESVPIRESQPFSMTIRHSAPAASNGRHRLWHWAIELEGQPVASGSTFPQVELDPATVGRGRP
jgi:protein arginine N-methyltransferase 1